MKKWMWRILGQLFCRHKWETYRFGDACKKCGKYRDNIWY